MTAQPNAASPSSLSHVKNAFEILAEGSAAVAASLVDVAVNGKSEVAKVQAAMAVLDRVGLPAKVDVGITATHLIGVVADTGPTQSAADRVKERLTQMREQQQLAASQGSKDGVVVPFPTIIHGEVDE